MKISKLVKKLALDVDSAESLVKQRVQQEEAICARWCFRTGIRAGAGARPKISAPR